MRYRVNLAAASLLALTGAFSVQAQTPPEQIRDWPGLTYLGQVGGLETWTVENSDDLWMRAPDGRSLIRGEIFSVSGRNLGAALKGGAPSVLEPVTAGPDWANASPDLVRAAHDLVVTEGFSILIGADDAPAVWALMDVSSPASAATYVMLKDRIEDGTLSLRVIPVVTGTPGSYERMRLAISQPGPVNAIRDLVKGGDLPAGAFVDEDRLEISEGLISRVENNARLADRISPPGLPFLMWMGAEGPAAYVGVPDPEVFIFAPRHGAPDHDQTSGN